MIILIGPLPPPVHGESLITERVKDRLFAAHIPLLVCNTSPRPGTRGLAYFYSRAVAYFRCLCAVYRARPGGEKSAIYLALSSGLGLVGELAVVMLARLTRYELIFHHHSFSYIAKPNAILKAMIKVAGRGQVHIALCPTMAAKLRQIYNSQLQIEILSNVGIMGLPKTDGARPVESCEVIGYLSNISFVKGIDRYLDLLAMLRSKGSGVRGLIAGPFDNAEVQKFVERRIREIGGIDYVGAVYEERKEAFLASIDLLVFPSRYPLEAQPLVVFEAQAAGVPVAASKRGCLADLVWADSALLLDPAASNLEPLAKRIREWEQNPHSFHAVADRVREVFNSMAEQSAKESARFDALVSSYY